MQITHEAHIHTVHVHLSSRNKYRRHVCNKNCHLGSISTGCKAWPLNKWSFNFRPSNTTLFIAVGS